MTSLWIALFSMALLLGSKLPKSYLMANIGMNQYVHLGTDFELKKIKKISDDINIISK